MDLLPSPKERARYGMASNATSLVEMAAQLGHLDVMKLLIQAKIFKDRAEEEGRVVMGSGEGAVKVS